MPPEVLHTTGLGSVWAITDSSGAVVQTEQTDALGVPIGSQGVRRDAAT